MSEMMKEERQGNQLENRKRPLGNIPSLFEELKSLLPPHLIRKKTGRCVRDILSGSISYIKRLQQIQRMISPRVDFPDKPPPQNLTPMRRSIPKRQMVKDILHQQRRQQLRSQQQQQQRKLVPVPAPKSFVKTPVAVTVTEAVENKNMANGDSDYVILDLDDQQKPQDTQMSQPKFSDNFYPTKNTVIRLEVQVDDSECNVEDCLCKFDESLEMKNGSPQKEIGESCPDVTIDPKIALQDHDYVKHPFWVESLSMTSINQTYLAEKDLLPITSTREQNEDKENLHGQEAGDETPMEEIDNTKEILQDHFSKDLFQEEKIRVGFSTLEIISGGGCTSDVTNNLVNHSALEKSSENSCPDILEDRNIKKELILGDLEKSGTEISTEVLKEDCDTEIVNEIATEKDAVKNFEETVTHQESIEENVFNDSAELAELDSSFLGTWFENYFDTHLAKKD